MEEKSNRLDKVFEDKELADQAVIAVEKRIHHEDMEPEQPTTAQAEVTNPAEIAKTQV